MSKKKGKFQLTEPRDKKLIERYYYWSEIKRLRFDDCIDKLSKEEFFISPLRVQRIITANSEYLHELINKKPNVNKLKIFCK
jgi:hypothetical protein